MSCLHDHETHHPGEPLPAQQGPSHQLGDDVLGLRVGSARKATLCVDYANVSPAHRPLGITGAVTEPEDLGSSPCHGEGASTASPSAPTSDFSSHRVETPLPEGATQSSRLLASSTPMLATTNGTR